jgi:ankyrin repeat protein
LLRAVVELLLTRAAVNFNAGEVFIHAVRNFRPETFHLLLGQTINHQALFTVVREALKTKRTIRKTIFADLLGRLERDHLNAALDHLVFEEDADLELLRMILNAGAEAAHDDGVCVKHAAAALDKDVLRVLSEYLGHHSGVYSRALESMVSRGRQWIDEKHMEVLDILLKYGASGPAAGKAMMEVVEHLVGQDGAKAQLAEALLRKLFAANVDVNYENGKAIYLAARRGDPFLLSLLLSNGATSSSSTLALTAAVLSNHDEALVRRMIEIFSDRRSAQPDFNGPPFPGMSPVLFQCLKAYPGSVALIESLVKAGCRLETTVPILIDPVESREGSMGRSGGPEPATVLLWALMQKNELCPPSTVETLIRLGADVSYTTPLSRTTPLLAAVRSGKTEAARMLLAAGANVSAKDFRGYSALFYASRDGNADLIRLLLPYKPATNDGSLHEAARYFHVEVIRLLLEAGHDPNYRCGKHGGRTALGEIALNSVPPADTTAAEEALDALSAAAASPLLRVEGKTVIFLALDNRHNEAITRLLLRKVLSRTLLNSLENTYQQGHLHYSPTMYVAKGILLGPPSMSLLQLLQNHGCEHRFYASLGHPQPRDAVGMPEEICEHERERAAREQAKAAAMGLAEVKQRELATAITQEQRDRHGQHSPHAPYHFKLPYPETYPEAMRTPPLSQHHHSPHVEEERAAQLAVDNWRMVQEYEAARQERWRHHQQEQQRRQGGRGKKGKGKERVERLPSDRYYAMNGGGMVTELRTRRGNVIGVVDLEELRKWQAADGERVRKEERTGRGRGKVVVS